MPLRTRKYRRKQNGDKAPTLQAHFKRRMYERWGILLKNGQEKEIVDLIQTGQAKFVGRQSNRVTVWNVPYLGMTIPMLYDSTRKQMITALPGTAKCLVEETPAPEDLVWRYDARGI